MKEFDASENSVPYLVDLCPGCRLFWFDPGEFEELPARRRAEQLSSNVTAVETSEDRMLSSDAQVQLVLAKARLESIAARAEGQRRFWRTMRRSVSKRIAPYPFPDLNDLGDSGDARPGIDLDFDFGGDL